LQIEAAVRAVQTCVAYIGRQRARGFVGTINDAEQHPSDSA
jgi:hypothetical protein